MGLFKQQLGQYIKQGQEQVQRQELEQQEMELIPERVITLVLMMQQLILIIELELLLKQVQLPVVGLDSRQVQGQQLWA